MTDLGALSGSREPSPSGLGPSGFDPARVDAEMLAQLLWDFFGPRNPRPPSEIQAGIPEASERGVAVYRQCAKDIVESLVFNAAIAMEARQGGDGETRLHPQDESAAIAQNDTK